MIHCLKSFLSKSSNIIFNYPCGTSGTVYEWKLNVYLHLHIYSLDCLSNKLSSFQPGLFDKIFSIQPSN